MRALRGVFFDAGNTLVVEEPGKHLWEMAITPLPGAFEVLTALKPRYRLGVPLETTCMVGDRLDTDIAGAIKAGIPAVWLKHPGAVMIGDASPTHIITRLGDLPAWLETMSTPPVSSS